MKETTVVKFEVHIPLKEGTSKCYSANQDAVAYDIVGTYAEILIQTLSNRVGACCLEVARAFYDGRVYYNDGNRVEYTRNAKIAHSYNAPSKQVMEDAIKTLKGSDWKYFLHNGPMLEQTIKAIMNDSNLEKVDLASFSWADLTSTLTTYLIAAAYNRN